MARQHTPVVPTGGDAQAGDAAVQRQWRMTLSVSSVTDAAEQFLSESGFDRGPWLVVAFAAGIASWFALQDPWQWIAAIGAGLLMVMAGAAILKDRWLPMSCRPKWLKADGKFLARSGGLAIVLADQRIQTVSDHQGQHGWWRAELD
ncbi:hypothetical protein [Altererythrobacter sp.]|uniref:hypothetical protein n=2 Tax=Altererythrobacter sp. TaxID=1872480 RepID=UPI001B27624C|nr:hypothetical protein [Altererythrobacter sp.]MBO6946039.1 hypothetical protein [Altererythrobacter sp.]